MSNPGTAIGETLTDILAATDTRYDPRYVHQDGTGLPPSLTDAVNILDFQSAGADPTGNSDSAPALQAAAAEAAAQAVGGYAASKGAPVHVPKGRWLLGSGTTFPNITLTGDGFSQTTFQIPAVFPDSYVFQGGIGVEFAGFEKFTLVGPGGNTPTAAQANNGTATTVATAIPTPQNAAGSGGLGGVFGFDLTVAGTGLGYASNGTILVGGAKRIVYRSWSEAGGNTTFSNCVIITGYGAFYGGASGQSINVGDTVTAVTTDNVRGIQAIGLGAPSYCYEVWADIFPGENILLVNTNCFDMNRVWSNISNRDCILDTGSSGGPTFYRNIVAQGSGTPNDGRVTAGLHIRGSSGPTLNSFGRRSIKGLYSELSSQNSIAVWIEDAGSIDGDNISLIGGTNVGGTTFATQTCVQLDSHQTNPLTEDTVHSANISLRNIYSGQIGRTTLRDNVRGNVIPANTGAVGRAITRYDTEDASPGSIGIWAASKYYWLNAVVIQGGTIYMRNTPGISATTWGADSGNWTALSAGVAYADRDKAVRLSGSAVTALRETVPNSFTTVTLIQNNHTLTSGTLTGGFIPVLAGESYGHVLFQVGTTGATLGTNGDSHWWVAVYDASGNLVVQTADQGTAPLAATAWQRLALGSVITPTADALYSAFIMVYVGTGGVPASPQVRGAGNPTPSTFGTGGVTAATGQNGATAPAARGATTATPSVTPAIILYT